MIAKIDLHPDFFRRGIASKLLTAVLDLARGRMVAVSTGMLNTPAIQLYEKHGFRKTEVTEVIPGLWLQAMVRP